MTELMELVNNLKEFIKPELVLLIPVMIYIGSLLKKTPKVQDWTIGYVLAGVSIAMTVLYNGFTLEAGFTPAAIMMAVVQGFLIAKAAVGVHQDYKQATVKRLDDQANG